jgi:hypothetical protein
MRPATDTAKDHLFQRSYHKMRVNGRVCVMAYGADLPPGSAGLKISKAASDVGSWLQMPE